jgi:hypothetical protein
MKNLSLFEFNVFFNNEDGNRILTTKQTFKIKRGNQTRAFDFICKKVHAQNSIYKSFTIDLVQRTFLN